MAHLIRDEFEVIVLLNRLECVVGLMVNFVLILIDMMRNWNILIRWVCRMWGSTNASVILFVLVDSSNNLRNWNIDNRRNNAVSGHKKLFGNSTQFILLLHYEFLKLFVLPLQLVLKLIRYRRKNVWRCLHRNNIRRLVNDSSERNRSVVRW